MKKVTRKVVCCMLAIGMIASLMLVSDVQAEASTAPAKAHAMVLSQDSFQVNLAAGDYKIANLKSSSKKNLIVRTTYVDADSSDTGHATISMYAKKKGKYKVSFDVVDRNNRVRRHHVVQVFATLEPAVKKVTIGGKSVYDAVNPVFGTRVFPKAGGKIKVKMTKGYSVKAIEVTTYDKSGNGVAKIVKNGKKIKLGQYISKYVSSNNGPGYEYWYGDLFADTDIRVIYIDKYTNEEGSWYTSVHRLAKKN